VSQTREWLVQDHGAVRTGKGEDELSNMSITRIQVLHEGASAALQSEGNKHLLDEAAVHRAQANVVAHVRGQGQLQVEGFLARLARVHWSTSSFLLLQDASHLEGRSPTDKCAKEGRLALRSFSNDGELASSLDLRGQVTD